MRNTTLFWTLGVLSAVAFTTLALAQTGKPKSSTTVTPMNPQARALLAKMLQQAAAAPKPAQPPIPAEQVATGRAGYRATIALAGPPEKVARVADHTVPGPAGSIPVRVYTPAGPPAGAKLPVLVFFHGGGFVAGDLDTHDAPLRAVANRAGCLVVSVAYRLAPEAPFPAAPNDAYAATAWVARHAAELGGDPARVAVGGDSAGGDLAAVVALMARDQHSPALLGQVLLYPDTDLTESTPSWQAFATSNAPVITRAGKLANIAMYLPHGADVKQPHASPFYATSLAGLPPALVLTGECDPQRDEGEAYAKRLRAARVPVQHTRYPGMIHGFFQMAGALPAGRQAINQTGDFLRQRFSSTKAGQ